MSNVFTFYDYIDANGINVIKGWLNGDAKLAKNYFNILIPRLAAVAPGAEGSAWHYPQTKMLKDKKERWKGFIEIRKEGNVQYRLLVQMEND